MKYRHRNFWGYQSFQEPCPLSPGPQTLVERFSRAGPRGRGREWATLGVHPLSWLLSNNRLEEVCGTLTMGTFSSRLLLSNQDKGCTPSVAHSLPLPLGPALLNLWNGCVGVWVCVCVCVGGCGGWFFFFCFCFCFCFFSRMHPYHTFWQNYLHIKVMRSVKTRRMSQNAKLSFWSHFKAASELFPELFKF